MVNRGIWEQLDKIYKEEKIQEGLKKLNKNAKHIDISKPIESHDLDWWKNEPDLYDDMVISNE